MNDIGKAADLQRDQLIAESLHEVAEKLQWWNSRPRA